MPNTKNLNIIAIIPARGGSKRLPGKNIMPLCGKPMIAHTIDTAKAEKIIDRVIVSSDDPEIIRVAKECGAEAPFMRPEEFAQDKVSDTPVIAHACQWLEENENYFPDIVVILRPTIPVRPKALIKDCVQKLIDSPMASSVRSVKNVGHWHPYWMLKVDEHGKAENFLPGKTVDKYFQSQMLPTLYKHDAYCDVIRRKNLALNCSADATLAGFYGDSMNVHINDCEHFINIDTKEEFEYAEFYLKQHPELLDN